MTLTPDVSPSSPQELACRCLHQAQQSTIRSVSNTAVFSRPALALAVRRRGIVAPRVPSDPDAVFQILVPQRSRPRLHVDEPRFPVCLSSHRLPLQHPPLLRDGKKSEGLVRLELVCSGGSTFFPLSSWLACLSPSVPRLCHCPLSGPPPTRSTGAPLLSVSMLLWVRCWCLWLGDCCCMSFQEMVAVCLETVLLSSRILAKQTGFVCWVLFLPSDL